MNYPPPPPANILLTPDVSVPPPNGPIPFSVPPPNVAIPPPPVAIMGVPLPPPHMSLPPPSLAMPPIIGMQQIDLGVPPPTWQHSDYNMQFPPPAVPEPTPPPTYTPGLPDPSMFNQPPPIPSTMCAFTYPPPLPLIADQMQSHLMNEDYRTRRTDSPQHVMRGYSPSERSRSTCRSHRDGDGRYRSRSSPEGRRFSESRTKSRERERDRRGKYDDRESAERYERRSSSRYRDGNREGDRDRDRDRHRDRDRDRDRDLDRRERSRTHDREPSRSKRRSPEQRSSSDRARGSSKSSRPISDKEKILEKYRKNYCSTQEEVWQKIENMTSTEEEEANTWYRSSPAEMYYSEANVKGGVCQTARLEALCTEFAEALIERGRRARPLVDELPPLKAQEPKLCSHADEGSHSSSSDDEVTPNDDRLKGEVDRVMLELQRKQKHPRRLHPEMWYNQSGEMNGGPLCRCNQRARRLGMRHGVFEGEPTFPRCDLKSNNYDKLFHYRLTISPITNFLIRTPTIITHDEHEFLFSGFSMFSHYKLEDIPHCKVIRFNIEYTILYVEEQTPKNFTIEELEIFETFLFTEILELVDLDLGKATDGNCSQFHFMPRFVRSLQDGGSEILSMCEVLKYLLQENNLLISPKDLKHIHEMDHYSWQQFIDKYKGMIVTNPGKKPCSIRVDQLDRSRPDKKPVEDKHSSDESERVTAVQRNNENAERIDKTTTEVLPETSTASQEMEIVVENESANDNPNNTIDNIKGLDLENVVNEKGNKEQEIIKEAMPESSSANKQCTNSAIKRDRSRSDDKNKDGQPADTERSHSNCKDRPDRSRYHDGRSHSLCDSSRTRDRYTDKSSDRASHITSYRHSTSRQRDNDRSRESTSRDRQSSNDLRREDISERDRQSSIDRRREDISERDRQGSIDRRREDISERDRQGSIDRRREDISERDRQGSIDRRREDIGERYRQGSIDRRREDISERDRQGSIDRRRKDISERDRQGSIDRRREDISKRDRQGSVNTSGERGRSSDNNESDRYNFYPEIVHFGIRPPQLSYAGNPKYQKAWRFYVKYRHLVANLRKPGYKEKQKLQDLEEKLQQMRTQTKMKRGVTVAVSSEGFYTTGIMCDVVQHAMLIPVLVRHLRFHKSLDSLEKKIGYTFKSRSLLQKALTHPSFRENYGTNPDHAKNSLTNCGIRQPEYGDRKIHYTNTRKKGINILIDIMSRFGEKMEKESAINHNERLEFLGDAVVEFLSSIHLFRMFPGLAEGGLATYRATIVQNQHLALLAQKISLEKYMLFAHGSDLCRDIVMRHALANCFEALLGAVYLDGDLQAADKVFAFALWGDNPKWLDVWVRQRLHPLQEQEPLGDRHYIPKFEFLQRLTKFENLTGVTFKHIRLLARAFTDRSVGFTNLTQGSNQRMEFLGDTVLQLVVSVQLYKHFPEHHEGHLSLLRSSLVNNRTQAIICDDLGMGEYALYSNPKTKPTTKKHKADLLESYLGALYIDKGLQHCHVFCDVILFPRLKEFIMNQDWNDPKSKLQQCCLTLRTMKGGEPDIPVYKVIQSLGPTNTRTYTVAVYFRGSRLASGHGLSIQDAEMNAAKEALRTAHQFFPQLEHQKRIVAKAKGDKHAEKKSGESLQTNLSAPSTSGRPSKKSIQLLTQIQNEMPKAYRPVGDSPQSDDSSDDDDIDKADGDNLEIVCDGKDKKDAESVDENAEKSVMEYSYDADDASDSSKESDDGEET